MLRLTWGHVELLVEVLVESLKEAGVGVDKDADADIITIARGGLIPAAMIAHRLGCKKPIQIINTKSYDDDNNRKELELKIPPDLYFTKNTLIVDDIVDTGETFKAIMKRLDGGRYCSLITKQRERFMEDFFFGVEVSKNTWVQFPWE